MEQPTEPMMKGQTGGMTDTAAHGVADGVIEGVNNGATGLHYTVLYFYCAKL